ncbi:TPR repeat-containing thioredoxin TTL1 isoform X2 [Spinacia oleracea]|uniref:TPR repeat-containing thioredoxin TTL1 isoform X2 n=1 Tax=Spinacia oleracea TaxID=3562 RepID=A0ABM3QK57_SPIOL|nr:TPR repeat-containing thioredoxin TTL1 isoform X2 [Spinacia oleracea]
MANTGKPVSELGIDTLSDRLKESFSNNNINSNKPDFRELDLGSPVSPLRTARASGPAPSSLTTTTTTTTTTSSSSSSSGSFTGRKNDSNPVAKGHSGELTGLNESTPRTRPGHKRSDSTGSTGSHPLIYSGGGGSSVNSPPLNVLPTGNICPPGRTLKTGMAAARPASRPDVLGLGKANYGHGSIMRSGNVAPRSGEMQVGGPHGGGPGGGDPLKRAMGSSDPEEVKRLGNEQYKRGNFTEALSLYDRAIELSPCNAAYRSNRAAAWTGLGRVSEAVRDCEDAIKMDPDYGRAHLRLGSLLIRLGQVDVARKHLFYAGHQPEATELHKLQIVEKHLSKCSDARKIGDWKSALREGEAAIAAGADYCPQLFSCRAECLLKLQQLDDIDNILSHIPKVEPSPNCCSHITCAEKAGKIDPRNVEVGKLLNNVRLAARARARGNDLFKSERFTEACAAYGEGLKLDPSNSVLFCNRAACWFKLGMWEKSIEDCNFALRIHPNYTKALLRRAASNSKLERWADAVKDYEILRKKIPQDNEVAESLFHAQVALRKSRGEEVFNMKFGGEVEEISCVEQYRATISSPGVSVVHFEIPSNPQCKRISSFLDVLCGRYPAINFLKVNIEESTDVANAENVRIVPTFKIYKNGSRVKEIVNPTSDVLEATVRHYSL